jgi:hypothetical protein
VSSIVERVPTSEEVEHRSLEPEWGIVTEADAVLEAAAALGTRQAVDARTTPNTYTSGTIPQTRPATACTHKQQQQQQQQRQLSMPVPVRAAVPCDVRWKRTSFSGYALLLPVLGESAVMRESGPCRLKNKAWPAHVWDEMVSP